LEGTMPVRQLQLVVVVQAARRRDDHIYAAEAIAPNDLFLVSNAAMTVANPTRPLAWPACPSWIHVKLRGVMLRAHGHADEE
jgi:hypothetical protein